MRASEAVVRPVGPTYTWDRTLKPEERTHLYLKHGFTQHGPCQEPDCPLLDAKIIYNEADRERLIDEVRD